MIHILQSVSNMDRGGIESMLMNYYRHLDRTRFQFDFLVNKKKPGFFDDEIRALGGRIFQSPGVAPQSYPAYLRSMQQLLAQHPEIKVLHAHNTRLPKDAKLPIKWFCKQFIPGAATDYWACGREAGIYYFGQSAWDARGVTLRNAIDLDRFGYRPEVRAKLRAEYGLNDKLVVGCVARLMAQKNHTRLLDIFAALKKVRPDSCRISLEQPDEAWAAVLKDADRNLPDRAQAAAQVRAAGYDIRQETLRLQQLYTSLIAKRSAAHA